MRIMNKSHCFPAVLAIVVAMLSASIVTGEWKRPKEYMDNVNRIKALEPTPKLPSLERLERLKKLEALGRDIERKWRATDAETYARLTYRVCATLASFDFGTRKKSYLVRSFAMRALEKADAFPLEVECDLVGYIRSNVDAEGKPLKGEAWSALRKKQATLWLHAWQRIEKAIDKNWDPKDIRFTVNVCPPVGTGLPSGVAPTAIKNPKLRAEYEVAIKANRQKAERYSQQRRARNMRKYRLPWVERFIIWAYMEPPMGKAELKELEGLLKKYVADAKKRARILKAVEKKKMPDDLIRRNTTQPANPKPTTQPSEAKYGVANGAVTGIAVTKVPKVLKVYTVKKNLKNHVEMALKIKPRQVAGDPIMLEMIVTNRWGKVVDHGPLGMPYVDFRIRIVQPGGKVPFTRFGKQHCGKKNPTKFTAFHPQPIKPGESYSATLDLSLLFDLTLPGTYTVEVETEVYPLAGGLALRDGTDFTLKVTGLEFKVSEPRPVVRVRKHVKDTGPKVAPPPKKK